MDFPRATAELLHRLQLATQLENLPHPNGITDPVELAKHIAQGSAHHHRFITEITHALHGLALSYTAATPHPTDHLTAARHHHSDPSVYFEQLIITGHPTHPLARHRHPLTDDDVRRYAPEYRPTVTLQTFPTPAARRAGLHPPPELVLHPWQAHRYSSQLPPPIGYLDAAPLASLRTLSTGEQHLKCAVDIQLTSAVRGVSPAAATNGPRLTELLTPLAADTGIILIPESSLATQGKHTAALSVITRPAPHILAPNTIPIPIAALAEPCPSTGKPVAATLIDDHPEGIDHWWSRFCELYISRPLALLGRHNVALEAHGQNTLIGFQGTTPQLLFYRDLGGIKIPEQGWPRLIGHLQTDSSDERHRKLLAAYHTTLHQLIHSLATWYGHHSHWWWDGVAHAADNALNRYPEIAKATLIKPWPAKALITMRLAHQPTNDQWVATTNPLHASP